MSAWLPAPTAAACVRPVLAVTAVNAESVVTYAVLNVQFANVFAGILIDAVISTNVIEVQFVNA